MNSSSGKSAPRYYLVGVALFMTLVVVAGFWPTYIGPVLRGNVSGAVGDIRTFPWLIHLHGAVFISWMVLLVIQTGFVARDKTSLHMSVGQYGFVLGGCVLLLGLVLTFLAYRGGVLHGEWTWLEAPLAFWPPLVDMIEFSILLTGGYLYRNRPEVHKRMMLFATVALLHAATVRMDYLLGSWTHEIMFTIEVSLIYGYDFWQIGRIHRVSLIGTLIVLPDLILWYLL